MNQWSTEELFFPIHDFEGSLWENREGYEKWDPSRFTGEWSTPELVSICGPESQIHGYAWPVHMLTVILICLCLRKQIIHSELDYRLPVTEGLAAFNVLQSRGVPSRLLTFPDENHVS